MKKYMLLALLPALTASFDDETSSPVSPLPITQPNALTSPQLDLFDALSSAPNLFTLRPQPDLFDEVSEMEDGPYKVILRRKNVRGRNCKNSRNMT